MPIHKYTYVCLYITIQVCILRMCMYTNCLLHIYNIRVNLCKLYFWEIYMRAYLQTYNYMSKFCMYVNIYTYINIYIYIYICCIEGNTGATLVVVVVNLFMLLLCRCIKFPCICLHKIWLRRSARESYTTRHAVMTLTVSILD